MKLRAFVMLNLVAMTGGCVANHGIAGQSPAELTLTGRVLSAAEIGAFEGDVEVVWYSYVVEPEGQLGSRIVVVGDRSDCPMTGDISNTYKLGLKRRVARFAIRQKSDEALMSELFITSCERVPVTGAK